MTSIDLAAPFSTFLRNAAIASQVGDSNKHALWLEAAESLRRTDDSSLTELLGVYTQQGRLQDAELVARAWVQLRPGSAAAGYCMGCILQMMGRYSDAISQYHLALECDRSYPQLLNNLAVSLRAVGGCLQKVRDLLQEAVARNPGEVSPWINLTVTLRDMLDLRGALAAGKTSVDMAPRNTSALVNYAAVLEEAQRWDEAFECRKRAAEIEPESAYHRNSLAHVHLLRAEYTQGWIAFESRWDGSTEARGTFPPMPKPQWRGEPLEGKTLLVWGEQGMGDLLQFCRLVPFLAKRVHAEGGRIEWNSYPQMGSLIERSLGWCVDGFTSGGGVDALPAFDYHLPLLSLPLMLHLRDGTIPDAPYLRTDQSLVAKWKSRLSHELRLKVGLAWTGSTGHQRNAFRKAGIERYARYFSGLDDVAFYSLQQGGGPDIRNVARPDFVVEDYTEEWATFDDTAAFVESLDLVITVCTSIAHLAGAIGKRTWLLLDVNPHWVWQLDRDDSPWYPNTRLYRQREFAQWDGILDEMRMDLLSEESEYRRAREHS
jgi:tetratricopeptide (TPR) repeat protein